jgi:hypothetical protein
MFVVVTDGVTPMGVKTCTYPIAPPPPAPFVPDELPVPAVGFTPR